METCQTLPSPRRRLPRVDAVLVAFAAVVLVLVVRDPGLARAALAGTAGSLVGIVPFLAASVLLTAYAAASDLDALVARAFSGHVLWMIGLAALAGAVSPFCSCGVIPLIAALLAMRVPLAAVMAFWLSSPLMDPSMFVLTAGAVDLQFALFKALAAFSTGLAGGLTVVLLGRRAAFVDPLRPRVRGGGCGGPKIASDREPVWTIWRDSARVATFVRSASRTALFLGKWLALAYLLEAVLLALVPAEQVIGLVGGDGVGAVALAVLIGVPAYLNGYAALPLVGGLLEQGMNPGAAMAFLLAGGVTSVPAAMAVFALVRLRVFAVYLGVALVSAFALGLLYGTLTG